MKRIQILILTVLIGSAGASNVYAGHNNSVNDILIGAGSGALLGQAIGGDTESTLVGTAVGGLFGYIIGSEMGRSNHTTVHHRSYRPAGRHHYNQNINTGRPFGSRYDYRDKRKNRVCKKVIQIKEHHGRSKRVVKTSCWYEDSYNKNYYRDGHSRNRHNHYKYGL